MPVLLKMSSLDFVNLTVATNQHDWIMKTLRKNSNSCQYINQFVCSALIANINTIKGSVCVVLLGYIIIMFAPQVIARSNRNVRNTTMFMEPICGNCFQISFLTVNSEDA